MSSVAAGSDKMNVLKMGYIDAWNGTSAACATTDSSTGHTIDLIYKAQTPISKVVLVPPICTGMFNQELEVWL